MRMGFDVSVNDYDRELYANFKTVLEQREGESSIHVLLKVLACAIYYEPKIVIEPNEADPQYRPDLLIRDLSGFPSLWIECGQVTTTKLDKLSSRYPDVALVVVKRYPREVDNLYERVEKEVRRPWKISYVSFGPDFVDKASCNVMGKNSCITIKSGTDFQLVINEIHYPTTLYERKHPLPGYSGKRSP